MFILNSDLQPRVNCNEVAIDYQGIDLSSRGAIVVKVYRRIALRSFVYPEHRFAANRKLQ